MGATVSWAPFWQIAVTVAVAFIATAAVLGWSARPDPWTRRMRRLYRRMERREACASKTRFSG